MLRRTVHARLTAGFAFQATIAAQLFGTAKGLGFQLTTLARQLVRTVARPLEFLLLERNIPVLKPNQPLISVDDHLIEPATLWSDRLPRGLLERGPHVKDDPDGTQAWYYEGNRFPTLALNAVAGKPFDAFNLEPTRYDDILPGCFSQKERLADMDIDGVYASLCFPTFSRFCGQTFYEAKDKDLALLCVRAYNDFLTDGWAGGSNGRLLGLAIVPLWDPHLMAIELRRAVENGAVAVTMSENPAGLGLPSYYDRAYWGPVFAAAQELDVPICMHIGSGSTQINSDAPEATFSTRVILVGLNSMRAAVDLLLGPVFETFPNLKVVLSEGGLGWVPYIMERLDYTWTRYRAMENLSAEPPSEVMRRNIWFAMIDDVAGIELRHTIGVDHITWESDYPHADTSWPHSRKRVGEFLHEVPDDEVAAIVAGNAARLFRVDLAAAQKHASSTSQPSATETTA